MISTEKTDFSYLFKIYLLSLFVLATVFLLLFLSPVSKSSLSLPDGTIDNNPWIGSDVMTYVEPSYAFLSTGGFLRKGLPDIHRTVGYPLFLATAIMIFDQDWVMPVYIVQLLLFAMLFPALIVIQWTLYPERKIDSAYYITFLLASGVGCAYVGQLLTDQLFTSLLIVGMAFGCVAVKEKSWLLAISHVIIISYAAQIRPTLALFWLTDLCLLVYIAKQLGILQEKRVLFIIILGTFLLSVTGNGPAIRNYINHGIFTPTDILSNNFAHYLAGPILISSGESEKYEKINDEFKLLNDIDRIESQKEFAKEIILTYPKEAIERIIYHAFWNLFEPHWEYLLFVHGNGFGFNNILTFDRKINSNLFFSLPFLVLYSVEYILIALSFVLMIKQRKWFLIISLLFFLLPLAASLINGQGARMRLYAEPLMLLIALSEIKNSFQN